MKDEEKLEKMGDRFLSNLPLERPSVNFAENVMLKVVQPPVDATRFVYKPLINKWGWAAIFCLVGAVFGYFFFMADTGIKLPEFQSLTNNLDENFSYFLNKKLPKMPAVLVAAVLNFSFMALLEISMIKRFFDQRATQ